MKRLIEKIVFCGLVTAWRFATCPTSRSPLSVKATIDGVVLLPSEFGTTFGSEPSIRATTLFVVPKSMPMILLKSPSPATSVRGTRTGRFFVQRALRAGGGRTDRGAKRQGY